MFELCHQLSARHFMLFVKDALAAHRFEPLVVVCRLRRRLWSPQGRYSDALEYAHLKSAKLAVGDNQKIPGAAGPDL